MRISDWSSDVCASDLAGAAPAPGGAWQVGAGTVDLRRRTTGRQVSIDQGGHSSGRGRSPGCAVDCRRGCRRAVGRGDRKSVVQGKRVSVRGDLGRWRDLKNKNTLRKNLLKAIF